MKKQIIIICVISVVLCIITFPKVEVIETYDGIENTVDFVEVTIDGEVLFPGTYVFFDDITLYDLIEQAGGLTIDADIDGLNYQKLLTSGTSITISSKLDEQEQHVVLVNVNEATFAELLEIPYMTETKAANIIIYREEHGAFTSVEDLINVKFIGAATLENIRAYITI